MDDLKSKFFGLIQKPDHSKIPIVGFPEEVEELPDDGKFEADSKNYKEPDCLSDQEILESIDSKYFNLTESFDPGRYELNNVVVALTVEKIDEVLNKLRQQHLVVSNQVLQMILENQMACQEEFNRITEVKSSVDDVLSVVQDARLNLGCATRHFTTASLGILANYRKRTLVQQLLRSFNTLRTLQRTESRLQELLSEGDFPGAIDLLLKCLQVAAMYRHFTCVASLSGKLQDTLVMTEEHLDVVLAKICNEFDEDTYAKLQSAYNLLDKTKIATDQLHMHFISAVHNSAFNVVHAFAEQDQQSSSKKQYASLCKSVKEENLIPCLLELCKSMWRIILSYNSIVEWHKTNSQETEGSNFESSYNQQYVKQKLENGLIKLWHDIQTKVSALVLAANLSNYKFDDFLQVLAVLHRLSQIGEELCGSDSEEVASSVRTQSSKYFEMYHSARLEELKVFLEYESWTPCPVRSDFTLLHLQEFRGLRCSVEQCAGVLSRHDSSLDSSSIGAGFFSRFPDPNKSTPFDSNFQVDNWDEEILASIPDDQSGYFSEESEDDNNTKEHETRCARSNKNRRNGDIPLLTNTTLTVLRYCGKYLQMSRLLKSIALEVVTALCQLFEYYLFTVYSFFTVDTPQDLSPHSSSIKLQAVLKRIGDNLIYKAETCDSPQKIQEAQFSPVVDLTNSDTLNGLSERVVAVESLVFLSQQYNFLKPYLTQLLQTQNATTHNLNQFYTQTVSVSCDIRRPVYASVAWHSVNAKRAVTMMSKVNWEIDEVMTQHSEYVDVLLKELEYFGKKLSELNNQLSLPQQVVSTIWEIIAQRLAYIFVEGFSSTKKCSNAGRALMQLDYIQFISKFEKISSLRPIPYKEYVEAYVRAFYTLDEELEVWIREHSNEYSSKQLLALINCIPQINKKARQKILGDIGR